MLKELIATILAKGTLGLIGFILLLTGAGAIADGSEIIGSTVFLLGLIIIIGLKTRGS